MYTRSKEGNRNSLRRLTAWLGIAALLVLAARLVDHSAHGSPAASTRGGGLDGDDIGLLSKENHALERIAETITPSIVNIQTTQVVKMQQSPFFQNPFFRQFFGDLSPDGIPRESREHALGSGVIVGSDGLIVTNNHVVAKASDIVVQLADRRTFKAKVLGADPDTDVAVLRIAEKNLPAVTWEDSSAPRVGQIVLAFGNPFGLNFTVTRGIVSAVGRAGLGIENFENFIQTDAAINPGNSGGALVDIHGRVVGINTAIVSNGVGLSGEGGSVGVGFAIPADIAERVVESIVKTGKMEHGYLGVSVGDLTGKLAEQFDVPDVSGAVVEDVTGGSPAAKAGLKAGDVIRALDEKPVRTKDQLTFRVATMSPGSVVRLGILRDGKNETLSVTLGSRPANLGAEAGGSLQPPSGSTLEGMTVENLTPDLRQQLDLSPDTSGVAVSGVDSSSPAAAAGLRPGDVVQAIDHEPVRNSSDFGRLAAKAKGDVLLRIDRQGQGIFVVISPSEAG